MGTGDENRWWADEQERLRVFDVDPETGPLPALLRHRRPRRRARRGPRGLRADAPQGAVAAATTASSRGCGSTIPTGSPTRPATSSGWPARAPSAVWVEKIVHPGEALRDWPVSGTVGYEFLNDVQGLFVDPAGEACLTAARVRADRRGARRSRRSRWRPSSSRRAGRSIARSSACARSTTRAIWRRRWRGCRSTARTCATASSRRPTARRWPRPAGPTCSTARPRSSSRAFSRPRRR